MKEKQEKPYVFKHISIRAQLMENVALLQKGLEKKKNKNNKKTQKIDSKA